MTDAWCRWSRHRRSTRSRPRRRCRVCTGGLGSSRVGAADRRRGAGGGGKFVEFFAGRIANEQTRAAYARAAGGRSLRSCEGRGLRLEAISPLHAAVYIQTHPGSAPTVKQAPGRGPRALRLARRQPGRAGEPRGGRPGAEARRHQGGRRRSCRRRRRGSSLSGGWSWR